MTAKEMIKFMLVPGAIAGTIVQNTSYSFRSFDHGETITIIVALVAAIGYVVYLTDVRRRAALAKAKAEASELKEMTVKELEELRQIEENRLRWERDFPMILSWRESITGYTGEEADIWA